MFEKLGKKAIIAPVGIGIVLCCILSLAVAPMLRANPQNVPFAIVNLDKGAVTIAGDSNIGKAMADNLVSGETSLGGSDDEGESPSNSFSDAVSWTQLSSEEELKEALANNEYYGGIVIPANFTSQQMSSAVGLSNAPELTVYLNKGKNPQMATTMQTTLTAAMLKKGITVNIEMANDANIGNGMMSETMAVQMLVMPLFMLSMIGSIVTSLIFWHKDATGSRKKHMQLAAAAQAVFVLVLSAIMAGLALFIDTVAGGLSLPAGQIYLFIWFACFCCMLCFVALCDACFPLGALVSVGTFALGMGTAMLAPEMLPSFWGDWVCSWAPQAHIGNGVRTITYFGHMPSSADLLPLAGFGTVGAFALIVATLLTKRGEAGK